ncbi:hypothetical protein [Photobacterium andalusiense]|uniref:Uncharacterized protein n=1 Tax=Photobacterium andalusiense TaxID=2204296 RepID=A0A1Y6M865_9GAMM|nr:hypothetical protein [Photobacterium andalusiense]SMY32109.1 hypothetical protein PAND9192_00264 [Photobacterium andalusiense]
MMSLSSIMPIATPISSRVTVASSTAIATSAYSQISLTPTETTLHNQIASRLLSIPTAVIHYDAPSATHKSAINCYLDVLCYQQQQALSAQFGVDILV